MSVHVEDSAIESRGGLVFLTVLMIVGLIPIQISALGLQARELLIPCFFVLTMADFSVRTKNLGLFLPSRNNAHMVFVALFMFVVLVTFFRNPLFQTGLKFYWNFLCSFLMYLMIIYWANRNKKTPGQLLVVLMYVATSITLLGIFMLATGAQIPGLGKMAWSVNVTQGSGGGAGSLRIPFLEEYGQIGFFLALLSIGCSGKGRIIMLAYFIFCIIIGGGRSTMVGTVLGFVVWLYLNRKFLLTFLFVLLAGMALVSMQFLNEIAPTPQLKRLTNIGSLEEKSKGRYIINEYLIDEFLEHPVFGTGYGKDYDLPLIRSESRFEDPEFIERQLSLGSHGTHLQILKNLGIVGYISFILIWLYPVYKLMPIAMARGGKCSWALSRDAQTCIIFVSAELLQMTVDGKGSEPRLYIFAAIITCVISQVVSHHAGTGMLPGRRYKHSVGVRYKDRLEGR